MRFSLRINRRLRVRVEFRKSALSLEILPGLDLFVQFGAPSFRVTHRPLPSSTGVVTGELFLFGQYIPYEFSSWDPTAKAKIKSSKSAEGAHANL
jgi:hypothetical protein